MSEVQEQEAPDFGINLLAESDATSTADTFEEGYIIYEVISEQDHTVRVKGINRSDFNQYYMNNPPFKPAELTIPAAVESGQLTWQVTEIGEFALADYTYGNNTPGNAYGADQPVGGADSDGSDDSYGYSAPLYISKVTVSSGITKIGKGAFYRTQQINEIVLPETVVEIGEGAFYFDESARYAYEPLTPLRVNIPASVKTIGAYAYHGVSFDGTLKIPEGVEVIKEYAFACDSEASGIHTVEIASSVKKIERYAFDIATMTTAVLYQTNSPFPAVLDGSAEIEYSSYMFGAGGSMELTLFVPESLMESYRFRLNYYWPNIQVRNLNEYGDTGDQGDQGDTGELQESPLRFLYDGSEFDYLYVPTCPLVSEERRAITITIDREDADFQIDDIRWSFALEYYERELTEEELQKYLHYGVNADEGTMSFVGMQEPDDVIIVTAEVDGYLPVSFMIVMPYVINDIFLDMVEALTAEDIAETKKISYPTQFAFQVDAIKAMAEEITEGCTSDRDKILAVHTWLANHIAYDDDRLNALVGVAATAYEALQNRYSICDGYAYLAEAMLRSIGIPCVRITGTANGEGHAWNMAYDGNEGRWIYFDATWDSVIRLSGHSISLQDVLKCEEPKWFDFDVEAAMESGREFTWLNLAEATISDFGLVECPYIALFVGEEGQFKVLQGADRVTFQLTGSYVNTDIIEVDSEGNIKALNPGRAELYISGYNPDGQHQFELAYVRVLEYDSSASECMEVTIGTEDDYQVSCPMSWCAEVTSNQPDVVTVGKDGKLQPKKAGTAEITARLVITAAENKPEVVVCRVTVVEGRTRIDDGQFVYQILSEPSDGDSGTVEVIDHMLGKLNADGSNRIEKLEIPDRVTLEGKSYAVIGVQQNAFSKSWEADDVIAGVTELVFPDTLQYIGESAFAGFYPLSEIVFPEGSQLREVGDKAFSGNGLTKLDLSGCSQLSYVGDSAFSGNGFTKLDLSGCSQLSHIGDNAFGSVTLTEVDLSNCSRLTYIGEDPFGTCRSIKIDFADCSRLSYIGARAFSATRLTKVDLSGCSELREIGEKAFAQCVYTDLEGNAHGLTEVKLPDGLETIGMEAFYGNEMLTSVRIPSTVQTIGDSAFARSGLTGTLDLSGAAVLGYGMFSGCEAIETVILSDALRAIPESLFSGNRALKKVLSQSYLEELGGVEDVDGGIFKLPESVQSIGESAFSWTGLAGTVELGGVSEIGANAFYNSKGIETLILSDELSEIPERCFSDIDSLKNVVSQSRLEEWQSSDQEEGAVLLSDKTAKIGAEAFSYCINIGSVDAPGVKELGEDAFSHCGKLKKVRLSDELKVIPRMAFYECGALDEFAFGGQIESIGEAAFYGCGQLAHSADGAIELGSGLRFIEDYAFDGCASIQKVTIYSTIIQSVGTYCFSSYPVLYIYKLPSGVYESALGGCVSEIIYMADRPVLAESVAIEPTEALLYVGDTRQLVCTVLPENTVRKEVAWSSSDPAVAQVQEGLVLAKKAGVATITAETTDGSNLTASCTVTVQEAGLAVRLANPEERYIYSGSAIKPAIIVTYNGKTLTEGTDYTVKYSNNIKAAENKAKITVSGKGNFTGSASATFTIEQRELSGDSVKAGAVIVVKNSKASPVLVYNGAKLGSKDYKFQDANDAKKKFAEDGAITLVGQNNFKGERTIPVKVVENKQALKKFKVTVNKVDYAYGDGKAHDADVTVQDKATGQELTQDIDYTIVYNTEDRDNAGTVKFMVVGLGEYTGTVAKSFAVKPRKVKLTAGLADESKVYAYRSVGVTVSDDLVVRDAELNSVLELGRDYKVTYSNNRKVSTDKSKAKYTVSFLGNYKGSKAVKGTFTIAAQPLSNDTPGLKIVVPDMIYTKSAKYKPIVYVTIDGVALKSTDYKAEFFLYKGTIEELNCGGKKITLPENVSSETVYVKITGKGNYASADADTYASASFELRKIGRGQQDFSAAKVTMLYKDSAPTTFLRAEYTGLEVEPDVKVEVKNGKNWELVDPAEYQLTYVNNVNRGKATVIVTGKGNRYVGSLRASFTICEKSLYKQTGLLDNLFKALGK